MSKTKALRIITKLSYFFIALNYILVVLIFFTPINKPDYALDFFVLIVKINLYLAIVNIIFLKKYYMLFFQLLIPVIETIAHTVIDTGTLLSLDSMKYFIKFLFRKLIPYKLW